MPQERPSEGEKERVSPPRGGAGGVTFSKTTLSQRPAARDVRQKVTPRQPANKSASGREFHENNPLSGELLFPILDVF
jgi:hypothetical protein